MDASGVSSRRPAAPGRLAHTAVSCILPVKDMARMRRLYEQSLGLEPSGEKPDGKSSTRSARLRSRFSGGRKARAAPRAR